MAGRSAMLSLAVGQKESGKTTETRKKLEEYVRGNPAVGMAPRRALIYDTQNEGRPGGAYEGIKTLPLDQIGRFSIHPIVEIRRVLPFIRDKKGSREMTPTQKVKAIMHILQYLRNAAFVMEDINEFIYDYMPGDIIGEILSQRHNGIDLILHYHSLGRIHEKVWPHINIIRMHKCEDTVVDNRLKFPEKFEMFKIAENIVNNQFLNGNQYFYLHIKMVKRKIMADVSREEIDNAINDYITQFPNKTIKPLMAVRDNANKSINNYAAAFDKERQRLYKTYFTI
jgi:hypothetical protein